MADIAKIVNIENDEMNMKHKYITKEVKIWNLI